MIKHGYLYSWAIFIKNMYKSYKRNLATLQGTDILFGSSAKSLSKFSAKLMKHSHNSVIVIIMNIYIYIYILVKILDN